MTKQIELTAEQVARCYDLAQIGKPLSASHIARAAMREGIAIGRAEAQAGEPVYIIFDRQPGPECAGFVEVETADGKSIKAGEWEQVGNYWRLGPLYTAPQPQPQGEAVGILKDALSSFRCTQDPSIYPHDHWCNRALKLLEAAPQSQQPEPMPHSERWFRSTANEIERIAFSIPAPNDFTPQLALLAIGIRDVLSRQQQPEPSDARWQCADCKKPLQEGYECICGSFEAEEVEQPEPSAPDASGLLAVLIEVLDKIPLTDSDGHQTPTATKARAAIAAYIAKRTEPSAELSDESACRAAYENTYHKIKAAIGYDDWRMVWHKAKASAESLDSKRLSFLLTNIRTFHSIIFNGATPLMYKGKQLPVREAILVELDAAIAAIEAKRLTASAELSDAEIDALPEPLHIGTFDSWRRAVIRAAIEALEAKRGQV